MTQLEIRQIFKENKVQLSAGTIEQINYELRKTVINMAVRCVAGNVKRLTPDLMWVALGNLNNEG